MADVLTEPDVTVEVARHACWVRLSHWIVTASFLTLAVTGFMILMVHPRLYWGETGNDLTPALLELPISRNYKHTGYEKPTPFFQRANSPISASRTFDIFNQNGWGRSLHFLAAWLLVLPGAIYLVSGIFSGHFRLHIWPRRGEITLRVFWQEVANHLRLRIPSATGGPSYGLLQKVTYCAVVFVALPLSVLSGLTMSPAITAAYPILLTVFGGYQSARTIHFFAFTALVLFVLAHVAMVVRSGFKRQMRGMTLGD
ncbi:cytochrome b/b6 domain-containing protein [soil metagenome]